MNGSGYVRTESPQLLVESLGAALRYLLSQTVSEIEIYCRGFVESISKTSQIQWSAANKENTSTTVTTVLNDVGCSEKPI
jgi:hypothetical protein